MKSNHAWVSSDYCNNLLQENVSWIQRNRIDSVSVGAGRIQQIEEESVCRGCYNHQWVMVEDVTTINESWYQQTDIELDMAVQTLKSILDETQLMEVDQLHVIPDLENPLDLWRLGHHVPGWGNARATEWSLGPRIFGNSRGRQTTGCPRILNSTRRWKTAHCVFAWCSDKKLPYLKREGVNFYCYKTTLTLWAHGAETLIIFPLPLTLEPWAHAQHLPFYFFPLNKKETHILNQFTVLNIILF